MIASAGSGKTTHLVDLALSNPESRIAIVTYTNNNRGEIEKKFCEKHGITPSRVDVRTWFEFLLHECARPYQQSVYSKCRIRALSFSRGRSALYVAHTKTGPYFFWDEDEIYSDKISQFVIDCEENSGGLVTDRLKHIYDAIYIDELQDLAGYDLDVIEKMLRAGITLELVGYPRQTTYGTNESAKNSGFRGVGLLRKLHDWEAKGLCVIQELAISHRCNQEICDFADGLFPELPRTRSMNAQTTGHDGIFLLPVEHFGRYMERFVPSVLRYDARTDPHGARALNYGASKGLTFERVLILPHEPARKYIRTGNPSAAFGSREKLYVAVTRAKFSVAFLYDGPGARGIRQWGGT